MVASLRCRAAPRRLPQQHHREKEIDSSRFDDIPSESPFGVVIDLEPEEQLPSSISALIAEISTAADKACKGGAALDSEQVLAAVTTLFSRKEMLSNPAALEAVRKEAEGLTAVGT